MRDSEYQESGIGIPVKMLESGIRNQESESRSKCGSIQQIRNQESGIGIPVKMLESGIRNQESESRSKFGSIQQIRNQESGIKWSIKSRKRDRRIGRGEQNQELALAALENRKGSGGNENGESGS